MKQKTHESICTSCVHRVRSARGYICEESGKHPWWNQQTCPDYAANGEVESELMKCQACGRMLPAKAFAKFSITKCKRCAAKAAASRRKEKRP